MATAFSYLRFSSAQQAAGDSVRRQTEATADWCKRNKVTLDHSLNLRDEGVSAFKGKHRENPDVHGLAAFLAAVKSGRVPAGSYLVLENLDRLTREDIVPAVHLFTGILVAGVSIVQLKPAEQVFTSGADMTAVMLALVELSRGNSESRVKSQRIGAAWANKRKHAATKLVTTRVPGWLRVESGKPVLDPDRAKVVRRMFAWAREGHGINRIAQTLNAEKVPTWGRTKYGKRAVTGWSASTVWTILRSRATFGEYQPSVGRNAERRPVGDAIAGYYPPVVSRDEFDAARGALANRAKSGRGRRGKRVNLFGGIMRDARTGGTLVVKHMRGGRAVVVPGDAQHGKKRVWCSFMLEPLEQAIVSQLAEVKAADIAPENGAGARVEVLAGKLAEVEALRAKWVAKMDDPAIVDTVAAKLSDLEAKRQKLAAELSDAQQEAASPVSEAWGEARAVGKKLATDADRLRYRAAVRRAVEEVWVLIVPGRGNRVAACRVQFRGGAHRDYVVQYAAGRGLGNKKGAPGSKTEGTAVSAAEFGVGDALDLRRPDHAARLERALGRALAKG